MDVVTGCHLVGSVPLDSTESVFRQCLTRLPGRLKRLPDGETNEREYFVYFQAFKFPHIVRADFDGTKQADPKNLTDTQIQQGLEELYETSLETGYDDAAVKSYATFKEMREKGLIPPAVKFQVSLPTVGPVLGFLIDPAFQQEVEPLYEAALFRAMRNIQDSIPHDDLAIQLDLGPELSYFEGHCVKPWFEDRNHVVQYVTRMVDQVDDNVDLGIHYCYGDLQHKHYAEPTSLQGVVDLHLRIKKQTPRAVQWVHCPVPQSAMGTLNSYFDPLSLLIPRLQEDGTELYLGLVHSFDLAGTRQRIKAAREVVDQFGVATECGWGRTPPGEIGSIMEIMSEVSRPV